MYKASNIARLILQTKQKQTKQTKQTKSKQTKAEKKNKTKIKLITIQSKCNYKEKALSKNTEQNQAK